MWTDNEAEYDFLNFSGVAQTVAQVIKDADGDPISVGVSGSWGAGKSSMIGFIQRELTPNCQDSSSKKYIFVQFNAWLYQGYDDARAALIETVATTLLEEAKNQETHTDKIKGILSRVDWLRTLKTSTTTALSLAAGLPPVGLLGDSISTIKGFLDGEVSAEDIDKVKEIASSTSQTLNSHLLPNERKTPPSEISALRSDFEETLQDMNVTLVVLIDDLDRCLPNTTISTLEAIRLLLFLKNTAFVIAADDKMIKHAVKHHFNGVEDDLVTNYFDKLIQVPIRVPSLGSQEVRAYMMMLHIQNSELSDADKSDLRLAVSQQLTKSWQGERVDLKFIEHQQPDLPSSLLAKLDSACRLATIMTHSTAIMGNPRLIKRFLNAISIRMAMARAQGITVDEAALAKILLFERCGNASAFEQIMKAVTENEEGKPTFLAKWEEALSKGNDINLESPWDEDFSLDWLRLPPLLAEHDLRGALYVSREHAPLIMAEDNLSPEATDILQGLLEHPEMASAISGKLNILSKSELSIIMDRLLNRADRIQEWGCPSEIDPLIVISQHDNSQSKKFVNFLKDRPPAQIKANIIPKLDGDPWAEELWDYWLNDEDVIGPVKKSIKTRMAKNGNVPVK